jgi:hypothetical protein
MQSGGELELLDGREEHTSSVKLLESCVKTISLGTFSHRQRRKLMIDCY